MFKQGDRVYVKSSWHLKASGSGTVVGASLTSLAYIIEFDDTSLLLESNYQFKCVCVPETQITKIDEQQNQTDSAS